MKTKRTCHVFVTTIFVVMLLGHTQIERRVETTQIGEHIGCEKTQQCTKFVQIVLHRRARENCVE